MQGSRAAPRSPAIASRANVSVISSPPTHQFTHSRGQRVQPHAPHERGQGGSSRGCYRAPSALHRRFPPRPFSPPRAAGAIGFLRVPLELCSAQKIRVSFFARWICEEHKSGNETFYKTLMKAFTDKAARCACFGSGGRLLGAAAPGRPRGEGLKDSLFDHIREGFRGRRPSKMNS